MMPTDRNLDYKNIIDPDFNLLVYGKTPVLAQGVQVGV